MAIACTATALAAVAASACGSGKNASQQTSPASAGGLLGAALPSEPAHDFALRDQEGRITSTREYRGQVLVLAFIGTRCGAPCVVIANQIRGALDQLSGGVRALLVSVEPATDSRAAAARFLARVGLTGRARYLSGPLAALRAAWLPYRVPAPARGGSFFERFAPVFLLDGDGRARAEYALEQLTPEALAHDVRALER